LAIVPDPKHLEDPVEFESLNLTNKEWQGMLNLERAGRARQGVIMYLEAKARGIRNALAHISEVLGVAKELVGDAIDEGQELAGQVVDRVQEDIQTVITEIDETVPPVADEPPADAGIASKAKKGK
jgi:hypothetical protein